MGRRAIAGAVGRAAAARDRYAGDLLGRHRTRLPPGLRVGRVEPSSNVAGGGPRSRGRVPGLRVLAFNSTALTDEAAEALAGAKRLARLRQLLLTNRGTPLREPAALVPLVTSPALADLTALCLDGPAHSIGD